MNDDRLCLPLSCATYYSTIRVVLRALNRITIKPILGVTVAERLNSCGISGVQHVMLYCYNNKVVKLYLIKKRREKFKFGLVHRLSIINLFFLFKWNIVLYRPILLRR